MLEAKPLGYDPLSELLFLPGLLNSDNPEVRRHPIASRAMVTDL
jgi:hypothetical protein